MSALLVTTAIAILPVAVVFLFVAVLIFAGSGADGVGSVFRELERLDSPAGVAAVTTSQLLALGLVWQAAGRRGMRRETLQIARVAPRFGVCLLAGIAVVLFTGLVELVLYLVLKFDPFQDTKWLVAGLRSPMWPVVVFMAVVLAPLWEELVFRGFLFSALAQTRLGVAGGGLISNAFWAALHWGYSLPALMSVFVAGLALTWLVWKTGSIRIAVIAHGVINATAVAFVSAFSPYG